jgi:hypothetical protein
MLFHDCGTRNSSRRFQLPVRLDSWLRGFMPSNRSNLAALGLTLHDRASSIDFQVMKGGSIYASANAKQL